MKRTVTLVNALVANVSGEARIPSAGRLVFVTPLAPNG